MSTKFLDGPAADVTLQLRRAPMMLRAVRGADGSWDALDQIEDAPEAGEAVFVYILASQRSSYHMLVRGKNRHLCGWYQAGLYRLLPEQPADEHVRTKAAWQTWVDSNLTTLFALHKTLLSSVPESE